MERMTKQRRGILDLLSRKNYHPDAEEIYMKLKKNFPGLGIATVYRNLEQLVTAGMVVKIPVPGGAARFDGFTKRHYHVTCTSCGKIEDLWYDFDLLQKEGLRSIVPGFEVTGYDIDFQGTCRQCKESEKKD